MGQQMNASPLHKNARIHQRLIHCTQNKNCNIHRIIEWYWGAPKFACVRIRAVPLQHGLTAKLKEHGEEHFHSFGSRVSLNIVNLQFPKGLRPLADACPPIMEQLLRVGV